MSAIIVALGSESDTVGAFEACLSRMADSYVETVEDSSDSGKKSGKGKKSSGKSYAKGESPLAKAKAAKSAKVSEGPAPTEYAGNLPKAGTIDAKAFLLAINAKGVSRLGIMQATAAYVGWDPSLPFSQVDGARVKAYRAMRPNLPCWQVADAKGAPSFWPGESDPRLPKVKEVSGFVARYQATQAEVSRLTNVLGRKLYKTEQDKIQALTDLAVAREGLAQLERDLPVKLAVLDLHPATLRQLSYGEEIASLRDWETSATERLSTLAGSEKRVARELLHAVRCMLSSLGESVDPVHNLPKGYDWTDGQGHHFIVTG